MYNAISQVVFFHNVSYQRRAQDRVSTEGASTGTIEAVHILPCIMQLYPAVTVLYEEDSFDPTTPNAPAASGTRVGVATEQVAAYSWIVAGRRVYLLSAHHGEVYYHSNVIVLLNHYLENATGMTM